MRPQGSYRVQTFPNTRYGSTTRFCYTAQSPISDTATSAYRIRSRVRLVFSHVPYSYTSMKKSPRPFRFEVKRSRLPYRKISTFPLDVVAPISTEAQNEQGASGPKSVRASDTTSLRSEGRILPSLWGEKVWVEEPVVSAPTPSEPIEGRETPEELEIEPSAAAFEMSEPTADLADAEPSRPKGAGALRNHLMTCRAASAGSVAYRGLPGKSQHRNVRPGANWQGIRTPLLGRLGSA